MKKIIVSLLAIAFPLLSFAQITTDNYGNVKIKRSEQSDYTMLGIGSQPYGYTQYQMGAHARVLTIGKYDVGVFGYANPNNPQEIGRSIGVCGIGGMQQQASITAY
jgi:hypothetical protein